MRHYFIVSVIVPKILKFLLSLIFILLSACQHTDTVDEQILNTKKTPDLSKAALFNMQLGLGYLKQGDRPRAKKKLLIALEQEPNSAEVNAAMAYYLEQTKELARAKKYYLKAIALSPATGAQFNNYGAFLCRQGKYKDAELYFLKAINDPNYLNTAGAYENAGLCVLAIPAPRKAAFYFTQALNQDPSRRESLYELIVLELKEGHQKRALEWIQRYPHLVLKDKILLALAQQCAQETGQYALAAEYKKILIKQK